MWCGSFRLLPTLSLSPFSSHLSPSLWTFPLIVSPFFSNKSGADALNLCLGEACFGLAGAFAYGDASASAQGGDLTSFTKPVVPTATSLSILTPVTSNSDSTENSTVTSILATPTPSFTSTMTATISVASRVPHGLLAAALAEVTKMVQIKQLHLREEAAPTPAN